MNEMPGKSKNDQPVAILTTYAEIEAVEMAIQLYLQFLKRFKQLTPLQKEAIQLLISFQQRLPTSSEQE